jgi:DNA polymerase-3 subunit delta
MKTVTPAQVLAQIESGELDAVYLVLGDDEHEKAEVADAFERVIDEGLRPFNVERLDGADTGLGEVIEATRTLPMMVPRRLVVLLRAERSLVPKRESLAATAELEEFNAYLAAPAAHATLVLVAGDLDKRRGTTKRLLAAATVVMCGVVESVSDAERWVRRKVASEGATIDPAAARQLAEMAGPDLMRLRGDVERLVLFAAGQDMIGLDDVRATASPAAAHDDWAVARAIERGRAPLALKELALVLEAGAAPYMVLGQLAWVARTKLSGDRVPAAIQAVFDADLALKSSAGDHRVLLERLVMQLCGVGSTRAR